MENYTRFRKAISHWSLVSIKKLWQHFRERKKFWEETRWDLWPGEHKLHIDHCSAFRFILLVLHAPTYNLAKVLILNQATLTVNFHFLRKLLRIKNSIFVGRSVSHLEEIREHRFQLGSFEASLAQRMEERNNIYPGFKCVLLIVCKILWLALTDLLFVTYFQWRYHVTLCQKKCFFRLHLALCKGKRLFFIFVFSVVFFREP